jgi:hypothetical protein
MPPPPSQQPRPQPPLNTCRVRQLGGGAFAHRGPRHAPLTRHAASTASWPSRPPTPPPRPARPPAGPLGSAAASRASVSPGTADRGPFTASPRSNRRGAPVATPQQLKPWLDSLSKENQQPAAGAAAAALGAAPSYDSPAYTYGGTYDAGASSSMLPMGPDAPLYQPSWLLKRWAGPRGAGRQGRMEDVSVCVGGGGAVTGPVAGAALSAARPPPLPQAQRRRRRLAQHGAAAVLRRRGGRGARAAAHQAARPAGEALGRGQAAATHALRWLPGRRQQRSWATAARSHRAPLPLPIHPRGL